MRWMPFLIKVSSDTATVLIEHATITGTTCCVVLCGHCKRRITGKQGAKPLAALCLVKAGPGSTSRHSGEYFTVATRVNLQLAINVMRGGFTLWLTVAMSHTHIHASHKCDCI